MSTWNVSELVTAWVVMAVILLATWIATFWLLRASLRAVEWLITSLP